MFHLIVYRPASYISDMLQFCLPVTQLCLKKPPEKLHFKDSCYDVHNGVELRFKCFSREIPGQ